MGLSLNVRNRLGKIATIELNSEEFVVCRFHPNNSVYLLDAQLKGWYPTHAFKRLLYYLLVMITNR